MNSVIFRSAAMVGRVFDTEVRSRADRKTVMHKLRKTMKKARSYQRYLRDI